MKEIKKTAQASLEDDVRQVEEAREKGFTGTITEITPIDSNQYYKDDTGRYENKEGYSVLTVVDDEKKTGFTSFFSKPGVKGYDKTNVCAFKQKYKSAPKIGLKVEVMIDEAGFFRLKF
jgi:hypothetical protein